MEVSVTDFFGVLVLLVVISWFVLPIAWARGLLIAARLWGRLRPAWIEVEGCRWFYLRGGSGPVMLALHGFGADADNWLRVAPYLTRHFHVIAPDLPGFGRSTADDDAEFDINSQVDRLHAFLEAIGALPKVLAGSSMGGWIAAAYTDRYPGQVKGLWLLAPLGVHDCSQSSMMESIQQNRDSPFQIGKLSQFRQRVLEPMFGRVPWSPRPLQIYYAKRAQKLCTAAPLMFRQVRGESEALESIGTRIDIPVLLQWGAQDNAVDVSGVEPLKKSVPALTIQIQEGVGHLPMLETPAASIRYFAEFCARHNLF
jgi:pimeloyl-ACP methyl ester carboxylesterase